MRGTPRTLDDFASITVGDGDATTFARWGGAGPPLLLLHGFPETHRMWRDIAPVLAADFTVVCADLRGYGRSGCPASDDRHAPYAKRAMAGDLVELMRALGFARFAVAGHDRGARVACRLALDHPTRISRIAVLDIVPAEAVWSRADARFALAYWPWVLLAQAAPLPERLVQACPQAIVDDALAAWGSSPDAFPPAVREAYVDALRDPAHVHAICEEYRAAATIDRAHDRADLAAGRRIACPLLALWSAAGSVGQWYDDAGGPHALWRERADHVAGRAVDGGHFFPEEHPADTAAALRAFFAEAA